MTGHDYDAIIVGAGVSGATAAILLAHAGWSVALVEKRTFPRRKVCGECVAASNLPLLDALGIGDAFDQRAGEPLRRVGLFTGEHRLIAALPRHDHPRHGWGRALGREHLDTLLVARAAALGVSVWQPWTVRATTRDGLLHACRLRSAESGADTQLRAPVLIDAHGSWEPDPLEQRPDGKRVDAPPRAGDLFAFKGNFSDADLDPDLLPVLAFEGGYGGMVVAEDGLLTIACCVRRDALRSMRARAPGARAAQAVQAHLEAACVGVRTTLAAARPRGAWLGVGPIRPGIRPLSRAPGLFAIGNAAGEAHPILGEGISMAIQSAWLLCAELVPVRAAFATGEDASLRVARAYSAAWRRGFASRIHAAAVFSHLAMRPGSAGALLPLLRRWPGILTAGARVGGKVRCVVDTATMAAT